MQLNNRETISGRLIRKKKFHEDLRQFEFQWKVNKHISILIRNAFTSFFLSCRILQDSVNVGREKRLITDITLQLSGPNIRVF